MKKLIAIVATLSCLNAIADDCGCEEVTNPFEGFSAYLDIGYANAEHPTEFWGSISGPTKVNLNNFTATLGGNYRYNMGSNWLVGGGLDIMYTNKEKEVPNLTYSKNITVFNDIKKIDESVDATFKFKGKAKRSSVTPSIYASLGKSFDNVLVELLVGISCANVTEEENGKKSYIIKDNNGNDVQREKDHGVSYSMNKVVPMVGLKVAYAFNDHVSAYVTGRYMFNAKKHGFTTLKKMFNIGAGISYKF